MSTFRTKNLYYLRISANSVLPLYVYLDERHINWMTDKILQYVLADLRPLIIPKLHVEADAHIGPGGPANAKRGTVDIHRGDAYQFAYFFKKTEPHTILIKTRNYVALPASPDPPPSMPGDVPRQQGKRPRTQDGNGSSRKKRKGVGRCKGRAKAKLHDEDNDPIDVDEDEDGDESQAQLIPRRSQRSRKQIAGGYDEMQEEGSEASEYEMQDDFRPSPQPGQENVPDDPVIVKNEEAESQLPPPAPQASATDLVSHIEQSEPKPGLQLRFNGFNIFGRCLCVVVEPWPSIQAPSIAPIFPQTSQRAASAAPTVVSGAEVREQTPLFLPESDERERSVTPAPPSWRPPVPLFNDPPFDEEGDDRGGELMLFSQMLSTTGESRMEADDEFDGAALFGDADETKELQ